MGTLVAFFTFTFLFEFVIEVSHIFPDYEILFISLEVVISTLSSTFVSASLLKFVSSHQAVYYYVPAGLASMVGRAVPLCSVVLTGFRATNSLRSFV